MKNSRIDKLGRVVIPIGFRQRLGLSEGTSVDIRIEGDSVVITRSLGYCRLCGADADGIGGLLCMDCLKRIKGTEK